MVERMFELFAAATDVFRRLEQGKLIVFTNGIAGFAGGLLIDADLSSHDGAARFFPALTQAAGDQCLVEAHGKRLYFAFAQAPLGVAEDVHEDIVFRDSS